MPTVRKLDPFTPGGTRRELVGLIRRIQTLTLELAELRQQGGETRELQAQSARSSSCAGA